MSKKDDLKKKKKDNKKNGAGGTGEAADRPLLPVEAPHQLHLQVVHPGNPSIFLLAVPDMS